MSLESPSTHSGTPAPRHPGTILSWALYDWANSAFMTSVMVGLFPVFYDSFWRKGAEAGVSTAEFGFTSSAINITVALMAPLLGAIADRSGKRKAFLFACALMGIVATAMMAFVPAGAHIAALAVFFVAGVGFFAANVFYDAMLIDVADESQVNRVSALGFGLGYLGGGVLFAINVAMLSKPAWFGLADTTAAVRVSFATVAVWWLVFMIPLLLNVAERVPVRRASLIEAARSGLGEVVRTAGLLLRLPNVLLFIVAYMLYIDALGTVARMAVKFGSDLGLDGADMMTALLVTQFVSFPPALAFGWLGQRYGARPMILAGIGVYCVVIVYASQMSTTFDFWVLAIGVGFVQGGIPALSRSLFARLIPLEKAGELFGFYNMLGKAAAIMGPSLMGATIWLTGTPGLGILSLLLLFVPGALLLMRVKDERATLPTEETTT